MYVQSFRLVTQTQSMHSSTDSRAAIVWGSTSDASEPIASMSDACSEMECTHLAHRRHALNLQRHTQHLHDRPPIINIAHMHL